MGSAWGRWAVAMGLVGLGGALLFTGQASGGGEARAPAPVAAGRGAAVPSGARAVPEEAEASATPSGAAVLPGASAPSPDPGPARAPEDVAARELQTLAELEEEHARRREAFFAEAAREGRPMEYAQPPGPPADMGMAPAGEAPPDARTLNDPEQYRRYMRERVLETTRAQAAFFERSLLEQEEKLRRDEAAGAPEEVLARRRAKMESLRKGQEKFQAKAALLESRQGP